MEFEELKKIWNTQNKAPMFVINEAALHNSIRRKKKKASWASDINEIGLVLIAVVTSASVFIRNMDRDNIYAYPPAILLLLTAVYVLYPYLSAIWIETIFTLIHLPYYCC